MHNTRSELPKNWPMPRKGTKYFIVANHENSKAIPLLMVLRDILKIVSTRREARSSFSTVSSPSFESGFNNVLGSSLWGSSQSSNHRVKRRPIYVKKGKKYVKVKGKHHKHKNSYSNAPGFDIWGGGGIGL